MIGVFDSGFGGLSILRGFLDLLPQYDYLYLGDNAHAPYGNRSHETVKRFTEAGVNYLFDQGCSLIIIACNTASSNVMRELQEEKLRQPKVTDKKILGVIRPMAEYVVENSKTGQIGVVGTRATVNSKSYEIELKNLRPDVQVHSTACPLLVPLIEEGWSGKPETRMILKKYLRKLKTCNIDTLILGCTHYPHLLEDFQRIMGKNVQIPHPGEVVAVSLKSYLQRHPEIETKLNKKSSVRFLTTDSAEKFVQIGSEFLGSKLQKAEKIDLAV